MTLAGGWVSNVPDLLLSRNADSLSQSRWRHVPRRPCANHANQRTRRSVRVPGPAASRHRAGGLDRRLHRGGASSLPPPGSRLPVAGSPPWRAAGRPEIARRWAFRLETGRSGSASAGDGSTPVYEPASFARWQRCSPLCRAPRTPGARWGCLILEETLCPARLPRPTHAACTTNAAPQGRGQPLRRCRAAGFDRLAQEIAFRRPVGFAGARLRPPSLSAARHCPHRQGIAADGGMPGAGHVKSRFALSLTRPADAGPFEPSPDHAVATADADVLPGDEVRTRGREERNHPGDIIRDAKATKTSCDWIFPGDLLGARIVP